MRHRTDSTNPTAIRGHQLAEQAVRAMKMAIDLSTQASEVLLESANQETATETGEGAWEVSLGSAFESCTFELRECLEPIQERQAESPLESLHFCLSLREWAKGVA